MIHGTLTSGRALSPRNPVRQPLRPDTEGISGIVVLKAVDAVVVPHVPERRPDRLRHQDSVARIAHVGGIEHGLFLPILSLHLGVCLEAAACKDDSAAGLDGEHPAVTLRYHTADFALRAGDQTSGSG